MANVDILRRISRSHDQFCNGQITLAELGSTLKACVSAMEGLKFHEHEKRAGDLIYLMENPTWASDGNVHDRKVDEQQLLMNFRDWFEELTGFVETDS